MLEKIKQHFDFVLFAMSFSYYYKLIDKVEFKISLYVYDRNYRLKIFDWANILFDWALLQC